MARIKVWLQRLANRDNWYAQWHDQTGRRRTQSTGTTDREQAEHIRSDIEYEVNHGQIPQPGEVVTWDQFAEAYIKWKGAELRPRTVEKVEACLCRYRDTMLARSLSDVTEQTLNMYTQRLLAEGLAATTVGGHLAYLRAALRWAESMGFIQSAPKVKLPKIPKNLGRAKIRAAAQITDKHFAALVKECPNPDWRLFLELCWFGGLRRNEAKHVSGKDVDLKLHRLRIPSNKAGNADEHAIIGPDLHKAFKRRFRGKLPAGRLLTGLPNDESKLSKVFREIVGRAGVPGSGKDGCTLHDLRRAFGTRWASKVKPQVLIRLMRHADIQTTLGYYADTEDAAHDAMWAV